MDERGLAEEYKKQIESLYVLHTLYRIENAMMWVNLPHKKKEIIINSLISILDIKYPEWKNNEMVDEYKKVNVLFKIDINRINNFYNEKYHTTNEEEAKKNITKVFNK